MRRRRRRPGPAPVAVPSHPGRARRAVPRRTPPRGGTQVGTSVSRFGFRLETVLTPFAGVGSEVYAAVELGRRGIGIELKPSYYVQAVRNMEAGQAVLVDDDYALDDTITLTPTPGHSPCHCCVNIFSRFFS